MLGRFSDRLKAWWRGQYVQPSLKEIFGEEEPKERFTRPRLAGATIAIWGFWCKHWTFLVTTIITLIGLYIAYVKF